MTAWLCWLTPPELAAVRLLCFPYAGGDGSAYTGWHVAMATKGISVGVVDLPGRGRQFSAPPLDHMDTLVPHLLEPLRCGVVQAPFAFFGYSMGAILAYELTATLCAENDVPRPMGLFVAAHRAPNMPDRQPPIHSLPREEFLDQLRQLSGTPPAVLENPELIELLMPRLRADFRASETYHWTQRPALPVPVFAFGGRDDPHVDADDLAGWGAVAGGRFECLHIEGGHFFIHTARGCLIRLVADRLDSLIRNAGHVS